MIKFILGKNIQISWDMAILGIISLANVKKEKLNLVNLIILIAKMAITKYKYGDKTDPFLIFENEIQQRNIKF